MKLLTILILTFALSACGMSIEEYNSRVKYCSDNNTKATIEYQGIPDKAVRAIRCVDANGTTFSSKESK